MRGLIYAPRAPERRLRPDRFLVAGSWRVTETIRVRGLGCGEGREGEGSNLLSMFNQYSQEDIEEKINNTPSGLSGAAKLEAPAVMQKVDYIEDYPTAGSFNTLKRQEIIIENVEYIDKIHWNLE